MRIAIFLVVILSGVGVVWFSRPTVDVNFTHVPTVAEVDQTNEEPKSVLVNLTVPYVNEAPDDNWTGSWKNACEEATITMVEKFYEGKTFLSVADAKIYMQMLFDAQKKTYGSDANSDATRTLAIIETNTNFGGKIINYPSTEQIKKELNEGRPIIAFHRGFDLNNKDIPFLPTGSSYHTTVIKGYDEQKQQFITNDPGDRVAGADHMYDYELYMSTVHDYNYKTGLPDGPPRVLFTFPIFKISD